MSYTVIVTSDNDRNPDFTKDDLYRMKVVGGFSNAVAESVGIYQKMVNQGANSYEVEIAIFDNVKEKVVAIGEAEWNVYQVTGTLPIDSEHYVDCFPTTNPNISGDKPVFKTLPLVNREPSRQ